MLKRNIEYFYEPFKYAVIDNFFDKEDLIYVTETLDEIQKHKDFDNIFDTC